MRIVLATSNRGKLKEIKNFLSEYEVVVFSDLIEPFEIIEDGESFKENAIIKAKVIYETLNNKNFKDIIVMSDDSGISIEALNYEPNIFSARYAGVNASDVDNLSKVIQNLNKKELKESKAFYTASIAIATKDGISTTHGWMYGKVINEKRGENGFGYDPIFIPNGFDKTLGELGDEVKIKISHRSKAIENMKFILKSLKN